jgi:hypothetical protein
MAVGNALVSSKSFFPGGVENSDVALLPALPLDVSAESLGICLVAFL